MYKTRPMIVINFSGSKANAHALNLTWTTYIYTNITHRESMIICMVPPPLRHRRRAVEAAWKRKLPQTVWHVAAPPQLRVRLLMFDTFINVNCCHLPFPFHQSSSATKICYVYNADCSWVYTFCCWRRGGSVASSLLLLQQRARLDNKHY